MKTVLTYISLSLIGASLISCGNGDKSNIASGSFEADETIISSEVAGKILAFEVEEGTPLTAGQNIGYIDTTGPYLRKAQLLAQVHATLGRRTDIPLQLSSMKGELSHAKIEQRRIQNLFDSQAATQQQLDDINSKITVLESRIEAQKANMETGNSSLDNEVALLQTQLDQVQDQISRSILVNPVDGTVLVTYTEPYEISAPGKPLYSIARLDELTLRAYITADQLPKISLGQDVNLRTDDGNGGYLNFTGKVAWISSEAEFTPKSIQTQNERANKVYAVKVHVKNDGSLKIGMYGEIVF